MVAVGFSDTVSTSTATLKLSLISIDCLFSLTLPSFLILTLLDVSYYFCKCSYKKLYIFMTTIQMISHGLNFATINLFALDMDELWQAQRAWQSDGQQPMGSCPLTCCYSRTIWFSVVLTPGESNTKQPHNQPSSFKESAKSQQVLPHYVKSSTAEDTYKPTLFLTLFSTLGQWQQQKSIYQLNQPLAEF